MAAAPEGVVAGGILLSLKGGHDFDEEWVSDVRDGVADGRGEGGDGDGADAGADGTTKVLFCYVFVCVFFFGTCGACKVDVP